MSNAQNKENEKKNRDIEVKKLENSEVEINTEIPSEEFEKFREGAMKTFSEKAEVDGFRKGHAPENVVESKFGEIAILEEMAQQAIAVEYPEILREEKVDAIGQPEVTITKLAKGSPLGFKIKTATLPQIDLPDYKKVAKESAGKKETIQVTDEEVEQVITTIRQQRKKTEEATKNIEKEEGEEKKETGEQESGEQEEVEENAEAREQEARGKKQEGDEENSKLKTQNSKERGEGEKEIDDTQKNPKTTKDQKDDQSNEEGDLPEITDEVAKELGFDSVEDLRNIIRDNLHQEKETKEKDKRRGAIIDAILEKTTLSLPHIVIENELNRMMEQLKGEIAQMGLGFEKYLEHVGKTEEELRKASKPDAEKRAKSQLIINKIATLEKIKPKKEDLEKEVKYLTEKYDDADSAKAQAYVEMVMTNEAVLKFLERDTEEQPDTKETVTQKTDSEETNTDKIE